MVIRSMYGNLNIFLYNKAVEVWKDRKELEGFSRRVSFEEIENMELSFADYKVLFIGIMAGVSDQSYEEVEKNFNTPS